jgi:preprotein translocase subunit YajC
MVQLIALVAQQTTDKQSPGPFGDSSVFLLPVAIFAAFYFIVLMPMKRREKKDREDLFGKLKKNDEVLTTSGIIGIIAAIKDDEVVLKVDESSNTRLRVLKNTIARVLNAKETSGKDAAGKLAADAQTAENVKSGSPPTGK